MTTIEMLRREIELLPADATVVLEVHVEGKPHIAQVDMIYTEDEYTFPVLRLISF